MKEAKAFAIVFELGEAPPVAGQGLQPLSTLDRGFGRGGSVARDAALRELIEAETPWWW
jgi:hypothetical protein